MEVPSTIRNTITEYTHLISHSIVVYCCRKMTPIDEEYAKLILSQYEVITTLYHQDEERKSLIEAGLENVTKNLTIVIKNPPADLIENVNKSIDIIKGVLSKSFPDNIDEFTRSILFDTHIDCDGLPMIRATYETSITSKELCKRFIYNNKSDIESQLWHEVQEYVVKNKIPINLSEYHLFISPSLWKSTKWYACITAYFTSGERKHLVDELIGIK